MTVKPSGPLPSADAAADPSPYGWSAARWPAGSACGWRPFRTRPRTWRSAGSQPRQWGLGRCLRRRRCRPAVPRALRLPRRSGVRVAASASRTASAAADSAPGRVGAWGSVYSGWCTGAPAVLLPRAAAAPRGGARGVRTGAVDRAPGERRHAVRPAGSRTTGFPIQGFRPGRLRPAPLSARRCSQRRAGLGARHLGCRSRSRRPSLQVGLDGRPILGLGNGVGGWFGFGSGFGLVEARGRGHPREAGRRR